MILNCDDVKTLALPGDHSHRMRVREAEVKEVKEEWGPAVSVYIEDGVRGRGVEKDCNPGLVV